MSTDVCVTGSFQNNNFNIYGKDGDIIPDISAINSITDKSVIGKTGTNTSAFVSQYDSNGDLEWIRVIDGLSATAASYSTTEDSAGNVYVTGLCTSDTLNFYDAYGIIQSEYTLTNSKPYFCFVAKYDNQGTLLWNAKMGGGDSYQGTTIPVSSTPAYNYYDVACSISADSVGNIYICGQFFDKKETLNFYDLNDISVKSLSLNQSNASNSFIVKYSTDGVPLWCTKIGGSITGHCGATSVSTDVSGNIYTIGGFEGRTVNFYDINSSTPTSVTKSGSGIDVSGNIFIGKYDTNGIYKWGQIIGSSNSSFTSIIDFDIGSGITVDINGRVYATNLITAVSGPKITVTQYNSLNGNVNWISTIKGSGGVSTYDISTGISTDSLGNIYATGIFQDSVLSFYDGNIDGNSQNRKILNMNNPPNQSEPINTYLVKYNINGQVQWVTSLSGASTAGWGISADFAGNYVYITGEFSNPYLTMNSANNSSSIKLMNPILTPGNSSPFVVQYDSNGIGQWGSYMGSNTISTNINSGRGIACNRFPLDQNTRISKKRLPRKAIALDILISNAIDSAIVAVLGTLTSNLAVALKAYIIKSTSGIKISEIKAAVSAALAKALDAEFVKAIAAAIAASNVLSGGIGSIIKDAALAGAAAATAIITAKANLDTAIAKAAEVIAGIKAAAIARSDSIKAAKAAAAQTIMATIASSDSRLIVEIAAIQSAIANKQVAAQNAAAIIAEIQSALAEVKSILVEVEEELKTKDEPPAAEPTPAAPTITPIKQITVTSNPNVCFPAGTPVSTDQGSVAIEKIIPGIHTINNKEITYIVKSKNTEQKLVLFEKDALSLNCPSSNILISHEHKLVFQGKMIAAKYFVGHFDNRVKEVKYTGKYIYNVLMEKHEKMRIHNLVVETLHPSNPLGKFYTSKKKATLREPVE